MSNFIYFTDPHLRLSNTKRRIDNLFEAQLDKLKHIGKRAEELNSLAVVCGGDLGDSWDWKLSMLIKVAKIFESYPCPVYTIIGNHDVPGRNLENLEETGLLALHKMGSIRIIGVHDISNVYNVRIGPFSIYGFHSDFSYTEKLLKGQYKVKDDKIPVAVVHAPIGKESTPYCKGHKELLLTGFKYGLFGDIHSGFEPYTDLSGCTLNNPGSLSRLSKDDIDREPKISIISENSIIEEVIPYSKKEVSFDLSGLTKLDIGVNFVKLFKTRAEVFDKDPKNYVKLIGERFKYSKEAINNLIERIK